MPQSFIEPQSLPKNGPKRAWTFWLLIGLLGVGLFAAVRMRLLIAKAEVKTSDEQMKQGDMEEASNALEGVLKTTPPDKRQALLLKSANDSNYGLRYAAVDILGSDHMAGSADTLEHAFQDSSSEVRKRALETLYTVDKARGRRLLLAGLRDEDQWVREAAVNQFVGSWNKKNSVTDKTIVPMLIRILDDPYEYMPLKGVNLLQKLTGNPWSYKPSTPPEQKKAIIAKWKSWWAQNQAHWPAPAELLDVPPIRPTRSDPSPDFALKDLDGNVIALTGQKGRITLLNFWGTWCPPCRAEVPGLQKLHETFAGKNVDIVGAATQEPKGAEGVREYCTKNSITYKQALSDEETEDKFGGIHEVPVTVLIDGEGRIRYRWDGDRDYDTFRAAVERLLSEQGK